MEAPLYVWFGKKNKCAMRLMGNKYWRDGGKWGTKFKIIDNELISCGHSGSFSFLNGQKLYPCTEQEWRINNGEYVGSNTKGYCEKPKHKNNDLPF